MNEVEIRHMADATYEHRDMRFFQHDTFGDHLKRIRKADKLGNHEAGDPLRCMMAEKLVHKNATIFAKMLQRFHLRFVQRKGVGRDSFMIDSI
jgi:hypothetical protein